jgi:hypothetical protein
LLALGLTGALAAGAVAQILPPPPMNMCLASAVKMSAAQAPGSPAWAWINRVTNFGAWTWSFNTTLVFRCGGGVFDSCQECIRMQIARDAGPGGATPPRWVVMPSGVVNASPAAPKLGGCDTLSTATTGWSYWLPVDNSGFTGLIIPRGTRMQAIWQVADFSPFDGPDCSRQVYTDQARVNFSMP